MATEIAYENIWRIILGMMVAIATAITIVKF